MPGEHPYSHRRLLRRLAAVLVGAGLQAGILLGWLDALGPVAASTAGAGAGLVAALAVAGRRAGSRGYRPVLRAIVVVPAMVGVNAAILSLLILSLPLWPGQLLATACACLVGYVLADALRPGRRGASRPPAGSGLSVGGLR